MTLSGWFREYVYIPLGGNRKGLKRQIFNLFVVELLTGIWHGADWNFICWGLYYFVLLALEKLFLLKYLEKGKDLAPHLHHVPCGGGLGHVCGQRGRGGLRAAVPQALPPPRAVRLRSTSCATTVCCWRSASCAAPPLIEKLWNALRKHTVTRVAAVLVLLVLSTAYVVGSTNSPFLYFNF